MKSQRCIALSVLALAIAPAPAGAVADAALVTAVNAERAKHSLPSLQPSRSLRRSAQRYSRWLMRRDAFGHQTRIPASRKRFDLLGENLALNTGPDPGAHAVVRSWLRSPSHRRVVLARRMRWIGAAKSRGSFRGRPATIRVLHVGGLR
jgi:uncharacterized protein YkwD